MNCSPVGRVCTRPGPASLPSQFMYMSPFKLHNTLWWHIIFHFFTYKTNEGQKHLVTCPRSVSKCKTGFWTHCIWPPDLTSTHHAILPLKQVSRKTRNVRAWHRLLQKWRLVMHFVSQMVCARHVLDPRNTILTKAYTVLSPRVSTYLFEGLHDARHYCRPRTIL